MEAGDGYKTIKTEEESDSHITEFHATTLKPRENPDTAYYKLQDIGRQVNALGEDLTEIDIVR